MSSTGSREARARAALDKAEKIIIEKFTQFNLSENSKDNLENIRKMWNSASSGYSIAENFTDIPEKILKSKARAIVLFAETATGNVLIDSTMGESKMKQMVGALGDAIITGAALLTPQGWIITGANLALSLVDWDLGSVFKKIYGDDDENIRITPNGFIEVANDDGSIYTKPLSVEARRILNISIEPSGSTFGDGKDDVLFGGNGDDILQGRYGDDLLLGGNGYDTYFTDGKDTIRDDDGKGQVYFHGRKLTDATQIEKGSNIYKTKDNIKYEVVDNKLIVNDSLVIENFNPYKEYLDINLLQIDEISVSVSDASAKEKEQSMSFDISLSRDLKEGEFVKVSIPAIGNNKAKTYMFLHGSSTDWKVGDGIEYIFDSSTTYTYSWSDDENVEPDETISVKATIIDKPENLIAKDGKVGTGTIQDDDDDLDNPNDTFPDTDPASTKTSPIVIDLNNDGVKTISRKNNKIYFDLDNNKFAQNTSWIDSNDGILINKALITDNNITNGSQLFGNHTLLTNGNLATNGFEALKEFDENSDGIINELDQNAYENLAIWQDINSNAKLDTNELKSLKELGIKEINLNYTNSNFIDENGNEHRQTSSIVFENGNKASISDVWLDTLNADTKYVGEKISLSNEIRALPQVYAFGEVLNLRQAMAQDEVLKAMVQSYVVSDKATQNEMINDIIYRWTGSDQIDPNSRDPKQVYSHVMDARQLVALEHLTGKGYLGTWCWGEKDPNPHGQAAPLLIAEFNKFVAYTQAQISAQSKYKNLFADILPLQWEENQTGDLSVAFGALRDKIANLLPNVDYTMISAENIIQVRELIKIAKNLGTYNTKYQSVFKTIESEWLSEIENFKFVNSMVGTDGNDSLNGDDKDNIIIGGRGNDTLFGGAGDDMYYFDIVFGKDRVYDSTGVDSIVFSENVKPENIELTRNKTSIYITRLDDNGAKTNDIIQIDNFFEYNGDIGNGAIEKIAFQNGTQWGIDKIIENLAPQPTQGNDNLFGDMKDNILSGLDGDDTIYGGNGNDTINGDDGNDILYGDNGNDTLDGGAGNDNLQGGDGNDTLIGGIGNDTINGGNGNDVYIFNIGDGNDTITDNTGTDTIKFGEDISKEDITITRINYNDLKLTFKDNQTDSITLKNGAYSSVIENVEFISGEIAKLSDLKVADITGTNANDTLYAFGNTVNGLDGNDKINGSDKADTIIGGLGNDTINGGNGNDVYIFNIGDGNDTITDNAGTDTIKFGEGITKEDLIIKKTDYYGLKICFKNNNTDSITLSNLNIENFEFANGDKLTFADIQALPLYSSDENETIYGYNDKANIINALGGNDSVYGGSANDTLSGGAGNDTLYGDNGNDTLYGGTGNDNLQGGYGDDIYIFNKGDGVDTISDSYGNDLIFLNDFNYEDIEITIDNANTIIKSKISDDSITIKNTHYKSGDNWYRNANNSVEQIIFKNKEIYDLINDKPIAATDEADSVSLTRLDDIFDGLDGNDTINGLDGNDTLNGGAGNDTINAGNGNDTLIGSLGNDSLQGGNGDDTYIFNIGDGKDTIYDIAGTDTIEFGNGISKEDLIVTRVNSQGNTDTNASNLTDLLIKFKGNEADSIILKSVISKNATNPNFVIENFKFANGETLIFEEIRKLSLIGSDNNETIEGYWELDNIIDGKAGNDTIYGGNKNDTLIGSLGNDSLNGRNGNDTYIYNKGDGNDTISDTAGNDVIEFGEGISKDDIIISTLNNSGSLKISFKNDGGSITFSTAIENIKFANGETLNLEEIKTLSLIGKDSNDKIYGFANRDNEIQGNAGDDELNGNNANDTLIGGKGNDKLNGGNGNDTYIFNIGDGKDEIYEESGNDIIEFGDGISKDSLIIKRSEDNDLKIYIKDSPKIPSKDINLSEIKNVITIKNAFYYNSSNAENLIETIKFQDGSTLNFNDIKKLSLINSSNSTETLRGYDDENNNIVGNDADETIYGGELDDTINAGAGNDTIKDLNGNNTIYAGIGDDTINANGTIYAGSGNDTINANGTIYAEDGNDNINATGFIDAGNGNDIVTANDVYSSEEFNTIIGGKGDDELHGSYSNEKYIFSKGDGKDEIYENSGNDITIKFKDNQTDLITLKNVVYGNIISNQNTIENFTFANGETLTFNDIKKASMIGFDEDDTIKGYDDADNFISTSAGDDKIIGGIFNDTLIGGSGNDKLQGGKGDDIYIFNLGDDIDTVTDQGGDNTVKFGDGINTDNIIVKRGSNLNDLVIMTSKNDKITIKDFYVGSSYEDGTLLNTQDNKHKIINKFIFADQTELNYEEFHKLSYNGKDSDDLIYGLNSNDFINSGKGNDTIYARDGDDTLYGNDGDDILNGDLGNDILVGGSGNDTLQGGDGDDTYIFNIGDGKDEIYDINGNDTIEFGKNITKDSLIVIRDGENDLKIYVKNSPNIPNESINLDEINDVITLKDVFSLDSSNSDQIIESVKFNDGSTISFNEIKKLSMLGIQNNQAQIIGYDDMENLIKASNNDTVIQGGNLKDTIYGGNGNDVLNANAGDDTVYGGNGDDEIYGGDGDDTLYGNSGNDTVNGGLGDDIIYAGEGDDILNGDLGNDILVGESGNDTLQGGDGDDTYIFNLGDGKDIITERELSEPYLIRQDSFDTVKFTEGVNKDDILLSRNGDDLIIKNKTNGDEITVKNHFFLSNRYYKINSIEFDDGTIWDEKYIDHNAVYYGSDANDELSGYMGNDDIIKAGSGNDTIYGFDGDDEIYGEDGDDYLSGGNGIEKNTGNDKLYGGAGNDQLRGEDGNDYLNGGIGDDRYYYSYGDGFDTIENEGGGSDSLIFFDITRDRLSFSKEENDLIINIDNDANQGVRVKNYFLNDEYALDMIQPSDGYAYTKNDIDNMVNAFDKPTLTEDKNANIIDTKNDEILRGSDKNNTYYYHGGKDLIVDSGGIDTLKFMINGYRLNFSSNGTDLSLSLGNIQDKNNNNIVTIKDFFANENSIVETIQLKNGYKFSAKDIYQSFGKEYPKDDSSNTTDPQPNENNLVGGDEDNKYIFSGGQKTVIDSGGNDTIKFTQDGNGLNFSTNGTDLTLNVYNHENDTITVKNFFTNPSNIIEKFELKNGYTITSEQIYQSLGKEYPSNHLEAFGLSNATINKIVENLNSYSDDLGANLNYVGNAKNNFDIMQIYSN